MSMHWKLRLCGFLTLFAFGGCNKVSEPSASVGSPPAQSPSAAPVIAADAYTAGTLIEFKTGGNSDDYRVSGWSHTEPDFTWTEGPSAMLSFTLPADVGPLVLKMKLAGLIQPPELPAQPAEIYINQQKIGEWQVGETAELQTDVPVALTKAGSLTLELRTPKATSPKALGKSEDGRVLGLCVFNLTFARP